MTTLTFYLGFVQEISRYLKTVFLQRWVSALVGVTLPGHGNDRFSASLEGDHGQVSDVNR